MIQDLYIYEEKTYFFMYHKLPFSQVLRWKYTRSLTNNKIQIDIIAERRGENISWY